MQNRGSDSTTPASAHPPYTRLAITSDTGAISDLLHQFNGTAPSPQELAVRMAQARGLETVFLGELDGELVGLLILRTVPTLSDPQDWADVTELYVRPASRRKGVGRALVRAAIQYARSLGSTQVHLLVDPDNTVALSFYRAVGFYQDSWEMRQEI
jgi:ribosomal protein S18 acetylase RimI-like enzyme